MILPPFPCEDYMQPNFKTKIIGDLEWQMVAIVDGEVASQTVFKAERDVAIQRAEVLASWFDADLVLERADS